MTHTESARTVPGQVDLSRRYALPFGTRVLEREPGSVQIGTDAPRCVVVRNAPDGALRILSSMDGSTALRDVLAGQRADPDDWRRLLDQLLVAGVLVPSEAARGPAALTVGAHLADERAALTHRHGHAAASRILQARDDALVVIRGTAAATQPITAHLAAAGVGHLHHERAAPGEWLPAPVGQDLADGTAGDRAPEFTAELRARYPTLRVHTPAAHQHPTLVVMVGGTAPDLAVAAGYSRDSIPHLCVATGMARTVVGPLVLPGRSSCLSCVHRHRTAADPAWPTLASQLTGAPQQVPVFLLTAAACLAVGQVLEHVDGICRPSTVDGTLEWRQGDPTARRRSWSQHPECGCRTVALR
ncbi:hypothetical protein ACVBEQ_24560 [Nakamurella sp. GG22]